MEVRYNVGVRNRGHGTRNGPPNNQHVAFANDRLWKDRSALLFNVRNTPAQIMGSAIFRMAGLAAAAAIPAPRVTGPNLATTGAPMSASMPDRRLRRLSEQYFPSDPEGNSARASAITKPISAGPDPGPYRPATSGSNGGDGWSDLVHITKCEYGEATYGGRQPHQHSKWLRHCPGLLLMNNETGLNRGQGDDYFLYRGVDDPRFVLIPHDLDTILDQGGNVNQSIFSIVRGNGATNGVDGLKRFFDHPEVVPLYHAAMLELLEGFFNPETLDPFFEQVLGGFAPPSRLDAINRSSSAAQVLANSQQLTIASTLPGRRYPQTVPSAARRDSAHSPDAVVLVSGGPSCGHPRTGHSGRGVQGGPGAGEPGAEWKYLDDGNDPGGDVADEDFDDGTCAQRQGRTRLRRRRRATVVNSGRPPIDNHDLFPQGIHRQRSLQYVGLRLRRCGTTGRSSISTAPKCAAATCRRER
jgi:hypothetical protein